MSSESRPIHEVILPGEGTYTSDTRTPPKGALFNFELKAKSGKKSRSWIILENQGNTILTKTLTDRIFGVGTFRHGYYLAINTKTGVIYTAHFGKDLKESINFVTLVPVLCRSVPKRFRHRLEELNGSKRPFRLMLPALVYRDLLDREIGYRDIEDQLIVELCFHHRTLQLWGDQYRILGDWKYPLKGKSCEITHTT